LRWVILPPELVNSGSIFVNEKFRSLKADLVGTMWRNGLPILGLFENGRNMIYSAATTSTYAI